MKCTLCEIQCHIKDGGIGRCGMYIREGTDIHERYPDRYLAAVDSAIENMPMVHYHPRGKFLQVCTVGCNFTCNGCVSEILTDHLCAVEGAFQEMTPAQVIEKALSTACMGIMFCFNEPTVSFHTFLKLAETAKEKRLLVGCSTNAYMTASALEELAPYLDFVNVGIKGASKTVYRACGVADPSPIWRNLAYLCKRGIHVEVSAIFRKHARSEILEVAENVASLSKDIPLQVMRFIPFGNATMDMEPSVREAEAICRELRNRLRYVYLFNSPGTEYLDSCCPECGTKIMERGFFGPMAANLFQYMPEGRCTCGYTLPIQGKIHNTQVRETGYFGGYRTINALSMIRSILRVIDVTDNACVDDIIIQVLKQDYIKTLYEKLNRIDSYFETVDYFASLSGKTGQALAFRDHVTTRLEWVTDRIKGLEKPLVYCCLGHPLIAMFEEKMESRLIETAGGQLTNRQIKRESRPGITISKEQFLKMAPEIIIVTGAAAWPVEDVISFCRENGLDTVPAVKTKRIFHLHPFRSSTNPDWILGVLRLAEIFHPHMLDLDLQQEAERFYRKFYNIPFGDGHIRLFPGLRGGASRKQTACHP